MKRILFIAIAIATSLQCIAQDFPFGEPSSDHLAMQRYDKDTSANAVVLKEFGKTQISNADRYVEFYYHVQIKMFNSKEFSKGTVEIPLRVNDANTFESANNIRAIAFYTDESGSTKSSQLDQKQVFKEKKAGKYHDVIKFAVPNLKDGCVIEYSYNIRSPFLFNFRSWEFQSDIPKIHSEYCAVIPGVYNYNVVLRGPLSLTKNTAVVEPGCFSPGGGFKSDCSKLTYIMSDIPAFIEEEYMTAPSNFRSAMHFELADYTDYAGVKHKYTKEWKDVDTELRTGDNFGQQLKKKTFFKDKLDPVLAGKTSNLDKAKAVFNYIKSWYKWNSYSGKYSDDGLKKSFENRSGNVGDINLALVTAMNYAGISAEPVMLSTRSNGSVNSLFPVLSDFDYVVCKVDIEGVSYMLDATDPLLPFGLLPMKCLNDKGRVISLGKPSSWIDIRASQKEAQTITMNLDMDESGKITGTLMVVSSGYEAYKKRVVIKKFNSVDEYVEDLDERFPKIKFKKYQISNLDTLENALYESFEIEIKNTETDQFYVNAFFMDKNFENPFKLAERTYPVDLGVARESRIIMRLNYPNKFNLISKPKDLALALPDGGGRYISQCEVQDDVLILTSLLQLNKPIYSSDEYFYLKELFAKLVQNKQTQITLKKKI